jgi:hypothetical protein
MKTKIPSVKKKFSTERPESPRISKSKAMRASMEFLAMLPERWPISEVGRLFSEFPVQSLWRNSENIFPSFCRNRKTAALVDTAIVDMRDARSSAPSGWQSTVCLGTNTLGIFPLLIDLGSVPDRRGHFRNQKHRPVTFGNGC